MIIKCLFICFNLLTLTVLSGCEKTAEDEDVWVVGTQIGNQNMLKTGAIAYNEKNQFTLLAYHQCHLHQSLETELSSHQGM